jgi:hypothetical protein
MYTIIRILFPYVVAIYLLDCIANIKTHHQVFFSFIGNKFWLKQSGFLLLGIFPISEVYYSLKTSAIFARNGFYINIDNISDEFSLPNLDYVAYQDINKIERDRNVIIINAKIYIQYLSEMQADKIYNFLYKMLSLDEDLRIAEVQKLRSKLTDIREVSRIRNDNLQHSSYLIILSLFFFIYTFVVLPLITFTDLQRFISPLVVGIPMASFYICIVILAFISLNNILGINKRKARISAFLIILSPITCFHITKELLKNTLSEFDYLALAAVLLPNKEFEFLVRRELLIKEKAENGFLGPIYQEYWEERGNKINRILNQKSIVITELFKTPPKRDIKACQYCPLCLSEYTDIAKQCTTCNIPLRNYKI